MTKQFTTANLIEEIQNDINKMAYADDGEDRDIIEACKNILYITKKLMKDEFIWDVEIEIRIRQAEHYYSMIYNYPVKFIRLQSLEYLNDLFKSYIDICLNCELYEPLSNLKRFLEI